ncbi:MULTISPECIES: ATP-binding protein [unclassified Campylobacter]|uniref:ATP-binding protein n=1 Tax=unclassified Campylobacter TaxID=2593542 RepID=UPI001237E6D4|nr:MULTISPECIES: ATP-binding protein [unclassified Campylobacter]KAA6225619.1 ATP-binding protein [Campylobacter sp. LR185c]KAA6227529.1 ATP-binding protein [Campylobacter sp. LR196d]KAA6228556.1 ATP-binding protein [Campylobacter sp. LR286c]KAA6230946.1 ATP-binding protein [Campylobacter sp. LR291e]KAA6233580.1 ATP-binding protein [Campylobacter sp. LR264d]
MDWTNIYAAIYRARKDYLKPVFEIDDISLDDLIGIETQKQALVQNTLNFLNEKGANHALLWGAKGTGKSSLIKAVFNAYKTHGLRLVELAKDDLFALVDIIDELRQESFKFILFCDDFSFEENDTSYKFLKPLLDGSIEKVPKNILIYASSNRRHLIKENLSDNENTQISRGELHLGDSVQEKLSLSDRFGLWLSFYQGNLDDYLRVVDFYFKDLNIKKELLHAKAREFAALRASMSPRTAKQFYISFKDILQ